MRAVTLAIVAITVSFSAPGCGPSSRGGDDTPPGVDAGPCTDGATICNGSDYQVCQGGSWVTSQTCTGDQVCVQGSGCVSTSVETCEAAIAARSYLGCEYWPVDLDNATEVLGPEIIPGFGCDLSYGAGELQTRPVCWDATAGISAGLCDYNSQCPSGYACQAQSVCVLDAQRSPFAIVVSNPSASMSVNVTLTNAAGMSQQVTVAPSAVLPIFPQQMGMADASLDYSGIASSAYKLTSDHPIVAYQFNPLNNVGVFSNDASLLIPAHAYDLAYLALTYKTLVRRPNTNDYNGYVTVVGSGAGTTTVTVTPTVAVRAGANVPAIAAGATQQFTLDQFQTLNLEARAGDLTGSSVTCSQPCGVFIGHEATVLSRTNPSPCCADHLEEQLFPESTWGKVYVVPRSKPRMTTVPDMVRVVAQRANTVVTFNPPQTGCAVPLGIGEFCDVWIDGDVEVSATEPILVGHFLASNGGTDPDAGDPSVAFAVPTEQYRNDYTLLVPQQYNQSYLSLVAPTGGSVNLDGVDVTGQLATFGSGQFTAGRVSTTAGQHRVLCSAGCGIEIYGWSDAVSYLVAAGLDLEQIVVVE